MAASNGKSTQQALQDSDNGSSGDGKTMSVKHQNAGSSNAVLKRQRTGDAHCSFGPRSRSWNVKQGRSHHHIPSLVIPADAPSLAVQKNAPPITSSPVDRACRLGTRDAPPTPIVRGAVSPSFSIARSVPSNDCCDTAVESSGQQKAVVPPLMDKCTQQATPPNNMAIPPEAAPLGAARNELLQVLPQLSRPTYDALVVAKTSVALATLTDERWNSCRPEVQAVAKSCRNQVLKAVKLINPTCDGYIVVKELLLAKLVVV